MTDFQVAMAGSIAGDDWEIVRTISENMFLMAAKNSEDRKYAPLYIHRFRLVQNSKQLAAEKFLKENRELLQIDNVPDKLKWCRHKMGLMQKDVNAYLGLYRSTYARYEKAGKDYYPIEVMEKLARLYEVEVTDLMDRYNLFIYNGQGRQIKEHRKKKGMTQKEYAKMVGVSADTLKEWESDRIIMGKRFWEKWVERG